MEGFNTLEFIIKNQILSNNGLLTYLDPKHLLLLINNVVELRRSLWDDLSPNLKDVIDAKNIVKIIKFGDKYSKYWLSKLHNSNYLCGKIMIDKDIIKPGESDITVSDIIGALDYIYPNYISDEEYLCLYLSALQWNNFGLYIASINCDLVTGGRSAIEINEMVMKDFLSHVGQSLNNINSYISKIGLVNYQINDYSEFIEELHKVMGGNHWMDLVYKKYRFYH